MTDTAENARHKGTPNSDPAMELVSFMYFKQVGKVSPECNNLRRVAGSPGHAMDLKILGASWPDFDDTLT